MFIFPAPTQTSNFGAKRSGKPDGNTLSLVDILRNMTLLGNAQSLLCGMTSFKLFLAWKSSLQAWCSLEKAHMGMHFSEGIAKGEEKGDLTSGVVSFEKTCKGPLES